MNSFPVSLWKNRSFVTSNKFSIFHWRIFSVPKFITAVPQIECWCGIAIHSLWHSGHLRVHQRKCLGTRIREPRRNLRNLQGHQNAHSPIMQRVVPISLQRYVLWYLSRITEPELRICQMSEVISKTCITQYPYVICETRKTRGSLAFLKCCAVGVITALQHCCSPTMLHCAHANRASREISGRTTASTTNRCYTAQQFCAWCYSYDKDEMRLHNASRCARHLISQTTYRPLQCFWRTSPKKKNHWIANTTRSRNISWCVLYENECVIWASYIIIGRHTVLYQQLSEARLVIEYSTNGQEASINPRNNRNVQIHTSDELCIKGHLAVDSHSTMSLQRICHPHRQ